MILLSFPNLSGQVEEITLSPVTKFAALVCLLTFCTVSIGYQRRQVNPNNFKVTAFYTTND